MNLEDFTMPHAGFLIISGRILRDILIQNDSSQMNRSDLENNMAIYKDLIKYCTTVIATLPILCIYPFVQKYFVKGVMIGSVKG